MPGMDGLKVLRIMKEIRPETQIILLTGRGSEKESAIGIDEGAYDYLVKPINIEDLIRKMKEAVSGPQQGTAAEESP
jgi:DNA-binding response OmpR family regulator